MSRNIKHLEESAGAVMYRRVIEYETRQGNDATARQYIEKAIDRKVALDLSDPKARRLLEQVQDQRAGEQEKTGSDGRKKAKQGKSN